MPPWADVRNCGVNQPWVKAIIYLSFILLIASSITSPHKWLQESSGSFEEGPLQSSLAKRKTSSSRSGVWCSVLLGEESPGLHLERGSAFIICQFHQMSSMTYLHVLVIDPVSCMDRVADDVKWISKQTCHMPAQGLHFHRVVWSGVCFHSLHVLEVRPRLPGKSRCPQVPTGRKSRKSPLCQLSTGLFCQQN